MINDPIIANPEQRAAKPGPPEWATPTVAAELRGIVTQIKNTGAAIVTHDEATAKHRLKQDEIRNRIYALENPTEPPTDETALELAKLKSLAVQMAVFLGSADVRRSGLVAQVTAAVKRLMARLSQLTGRGLWIFENPDPRHLSAVHKVCGAEVERVLRGEQDDFDRTNESPGPVNLFTSNTRGNF